MALGTDSIIRYRLPGTDRVHTLVGHASTLTAQEAHGFVVAPFVGQPIVITPTEAASVGPSYMPEGAVQVVDYRANFAAFHGALLRGDYRKLVLAHPFPTEGITADELFHQLLDRFPTAFVYHLSSPLTGTWVGASPELLLEAAEGKGRTMALAATAPIGVTWDDKCIQEQAYVADYIARELSALGIDYEKSEIRTVHTGRLQHLRTDYAFPLSVSPIALAERLHPTPAVCGLPKAEAQQFIGLHEGFDRRFYAGFLGPIDEGEAHLFVNIRCAEFHGERCATVYAGGGLLAASRQEDEWMELNRKRNNVIGLC